MVEISGYGYYGFLDVFYETNLLNKMTSKLLAFPDFGMSQGV